MTALLPKHTDTDRGTAATPPPAPREPNGAAGMSARNVVVAVALLIAVTAAVALFIGQAGDGGDTGAEDALRPAPPFTLPALRPERGQVTLAAAPEKPTVVNFFGAWCAPCKRELPILKAAAEDHPEVAFLGVDHQDSRQDAIELLDRVGITYPAGYDPRGDIAAKYFVRGFPTTVFIDTEGRIVSFHQGELSVDELDEALAELTLRRPAP